MGSSVGTIVGAGLGSVVPGVGTALGASLGGAGGALLGGSLGGSASNVGGAYSDAAAQQAAYAQQAANMAQFTPVGITTRFGSSQFGYDPSGKLTSAGYTISPELKAIQDKIMSQAGTYDPTQLGQAAQPLYGAGESLFNLGQQYLAKSPEQAAADYMAQQQGLLAGTREQQLAAIRNQQLQTGRTGLATGGTATGMAATNPEMAAYYNALAQQNAQLAAQADVAGQQRTQFGAGLFGTGASLLGQVPALTTAGYGPLQTQLGLASTMEQLAQSPLDISSQLAGRSATAGAKAGEQLLYGGLQASRTGLAGDIAQQGIQATQNTALTNALSPLLTKAGGSLGSWFNNIIGGGETYTPPSFGTGW